MAEHKLSAVLELKDKYSQAIKKSTATTKAFTKETTSAAGKVATEWTKIETAAVKSSKAAASGFKTIEKGASQTATVLGRNRSAFNQFADSAVSAGRRAGKGLTDGVVGAAKKLPNALGGILKGVGGGIATGLGLGVFQSITGAISSAVGRAKDVTKQGFLQFVNLEDQLVRNASIMGIAKDESKVASMTKQVRELGSATEYTALQVADVHKYFAMSGWDLKDIEKATPSVLMFASATGTELGSAADIVSDYLTALQMDSSEIGRLLDVMGQGALSSNQTVGMMAEAFKSMAPSSVGRDSVEDLAIITGLLANQGIKGGEAGTYYSSTLSRLTSDSKDVNKALAKVGATAYKETTTIDKKTGKKRVEMTRKSTLEVMKEIERGMHKLNVKEQDMVLNDLFGKNHKKSGMALINSLATEDYPKLEEAIRNSTGAMEEQYEIWKDNSPKYKLEMLSSAYDEFKNRLGEAVKPEAMKWIEKATEYLNSDTFSTKKIESFFKTAIDSSYELVEVLKTVGTVAKWIAEGMGLVWKAGEIVGKGVATMLFGEDAVRRKEEADKIRKMKTLNNEEYIQYMDSQIKSGELYQVYDSGGKADAWDVLDGKVMGMTDIAAAEERLRFAEKHKREYFEMLASTNRKKLAEEYKNDFTAKDVLNRTASGRTPEQIFKIPPQGLLLQNQEPLETKQEINVNPIQINLNVKSETNTALIEGFINRKLDNLGAEIEAEFATQN